jgi:hypothetical protein
MDEVRISIAAGVALLTERVATTPPEPYGYGRDLVCVADLTTTLEETNPGTVESLAQDLYHRVTTERGTLVDDPDFGLDVRSFLSAGLTPQQLTLISHQVQLECLKDDRCASVEVDVLTGRPGALDITIAVTPQDPALAAFTLVLAVTPLTVSLVVR